MTPTTDASHVETASLQKTKKPKNRNKNKSKKQAAQPQKSPSTSFVEDVEEAEDGWVSVISKKSAAKQQGGGQLTSDIASQPQPSSPVNGGEKKSKKSKKRKSAAQKVSDDSLSNAGSLSATVVTNLSSPSTPPLPSPVVVEEVALQSNNSAATAAPPSSSIHQNHKPTQQTHPSLDGAADAYAHELEFLVSEVLGSEAVLSARKHFPGLGFTRPPPQSFPPSSASACNNSTTILSSEFIQLKAHLRAKEAECQVLRDEVVRIHSTPLPVAAPPANQPIPVKIQPIPKRPKLTVKQVQCDLSIAAATAMITSAPHPPSSPSQTTPPSAAAAASPPSQDDPILIKTLRNEIARLAGESTILTQRNSNLETRLDAAKRSSDKLQSDFQKKLAEARRKCEAAAKEKVEENLVDLKNQLAEAQQALEDANKSHSALMDETTKKHAQEVEELRSECEALKEANRKSEVSTAESAEKLLKEQKSSSDLQKCLSDAQDELSTTVNKHESDLTSLREELKLLHESLTAEKASNSSLKGTITQLNEEIANLKEANSSDKEEEEGESKAQIESLKEQLESSANQIKDTLSDLETQKALNAALQKTILELQTKMLQDGESEAKISSLKEQLEKATQLSSELQKTVDSLNIELENAKNAPPPPQGDEDKEDEDEDDDDDMKATIERYKTILAGTEQALSDLQMTVSQEETRWKALLSDSLAENSKLKCQLQKMKQTNPHSNGVDSLMVNGDNEPVVNGHINGHN